MRLKVLRSHYLEAPNKGRKGIHFIKYVYTLTRIHVIMPDVIKVKSCFTCGVTVFIICSFLKIRISLGDEDKFSVGNVVCTMFK